MSRKRTAARAAPAGGLRSAPDRAHERRLVRAGLGLGGFALVGVAAFLLGHQQGTDSVLGALESQGAQALPQGPGFDEHLPYEELPDLELPDLQLPAVELPGEQLPQLSVHDEQVHHSDDTETYDKEPEVVVAEEPLTEHGVPVAIAPVVGDLREDEFVAQEILADEVPTEELPSEELPAEVVPAEESPVVELPVEELRAEDVQFVLATPPAPVEEEPTPYQVDPFTLSQWVEPRQLHAEAPSAEVLSVRIESVEQPDAGVEPQLRVWRGDQLTGSYVGGHVVVP